MSNFPPNINRNHVALVDSELKAHHVHELFLRLAKQDNTHISPAPGGGYYVATFPPPKPEDRVFALIADSSEAVLRLARGKLAADDKSFYLKPLGLEGFEPIRKVFPTNKAVQQFQARPNSILLAVGIAWGPLEEHLRFVSLALMDKV